MDKTVLERLKETRIARNIAHVSFFNNGVIREDEFYSAKRIQNVTDYYDFSAISYVLESNAELYGQTYPFDTVNLELELGLIFNKSDVDENNEISPIAEPVQDIVRYYTGNVFTFLDGEITNGSEFKELPSGRQGYVHYDKLKELAEKEGLLFVGPDSFEEFQEKILSGDKFSIFLSADLREKEESFEMTK